MEEAFKAMSPNKASGKFKVESTMLDKYAGEMATASLPTNE